MPDFRAEEWSHWAISLGANASRTNAPVARAIRARMVGLSGAAKCQVSHGSGESAIAPELKRVTAVILA